MNKLVVFFTLCVFFTMLMPGQSYAQDESAQKWHYLGEVYMMFPNMKGETTVRNLPEAEVDAGVGDILGHLKTGSIVIPKFLSIRNGEGGILAEVVSQPGFEFREGSGFPFRAKNFSYE